MNKLLGKTIYQSATKYTEQNSNTVGERIHLGAYRLKRPMQVEGRSHMLSLGFWQDKNAVREISPSLTPQNSFSVSHLIRKCFQSVSVAT
jgi:hypothetical protein